MTLCSSSQAIMLPAKRQCTHCSQWFQPLTDTARSFCYRKACRYAMKLAWGVRYRQRIASGEHVPNEQREKRTPTVRPPEIVPKPFSWWVAQADAVTETCTKCEGPMEGVYVPPSQGNMGECAIVAHCRCGVERMILAGRGGVPYEDQIRGEVRPPQVKARRVGTSRRAAQGPTSL